MDLKLPIRIFDELAETVIESTGMLDLASGEIRGVTYEGYDVEAEGLPAEDEGYEFTSGLLTNGSKDVEFRVEVDVMSGHYSVTPSELLELKGRAAKLFTAAPTDAAPAIGARPAPPAPGGNRTMAPGAPWAICITPQIDGKQFLFVADAFPGRIYKLSLDGQVLGWLGEAGKGLGQFGWIHEIACPAENELYVAELLNWRLQKLTLGAGPGGQATPHKALGKRRG